MKEALVIVIKNEFLFICTCKNRIKVKTDRTDKELKCNECGKEYYIDMGYVIYEHTKNVKEDL